MGSSAQDPSAPHSGHGAAGPEQAAANLVDTPLGWVKGHGRADAQTWSEGDTVGVDLRLEQAAVIQDVVTEHKQSALL